MKIKADENYYRLKLFIDVHFNQRMEIFWNFKIPVINIHVWMPKESVFPVLIELIEQTFTQLELQSFNFSDLVFLKVAFN